MYIAGREMVWLLFFLSTMTTTNEAPFSSKEVLADGIVSLLKPAVEEIDERVMAVRFVT